MADLIVGADVQASLIAEALQYRQRETCPEAEEKARWAGLSYVPPTLTSFARGEGATLTVPPRGSEARSR